jgi:uncharacterized membrane protein HdeD (DUF308 family)
MNATASPAMSAGSMNGRMDPAWMLMLRGAIAIVFGVLVFAYPGAGALALVWLISLYAIVTGVLLFALGLRTRRAADSTTAPRTAAAGGR